MSVEEGVTNKLERLVDGLIRATDGRGPLLQRDYWGVIANSRQTAPEVANVVAGDFCRFPPEELVRFTRRDPADEALQEGNEMDVEIRMAGECAVRVIHRDSNSITLGTLEGHPEAGRITFGAYPDEAGDIVFHIRSRARSSSTARYAGFMIGGEPMQTTTWTDFIDRVAHDVGDGILGVIHVETKEIEDEPDDPESICSPTYLARGE